MNNLWPNFNNMDTIENPKTILEQQGKNLLELTRDMVYGSVEADNITMALYKIDFAFDFFIKGKLLENYKFKLFSVRHDIIIYPLKIVIDSDIAKELGIDDATIIASNQEDFENEIKKVFSSNKVKKVIQSIISLS